MKAKKIVSFVLAMAIGVSVFAGCATSKGAASSEQQPVNSSDAQANSELKRADKISMVLEGSDLATAQLEEEQMKNFLAQYTEMTGTEVELIFVPNKDYRTWQITQQAAGTMPEVYSTRLAWVWEDYAKEQAIDLTSYLEQESPYNPGGPWKDTFLDSLLAQSKEPSSGKYVSSLRSVIAVRIAYNKTIFENAGITQEPVTWAEFMQACEKIKAADSTPFAFALQSGASYASWFLTSIFGQLDEGLRNKMDVDQDEMVSKNEFAKATDDGLIDYTKDPFKTGFELFSKFSQYWNSDYNAIDMPSAQQLWLTGEAAMLATLSTDMLLLDGMDGRDFEYGLFSLPLITTDTTALASGKCTMLGGAANESWAISSTTKDEKLNSALDLLQYLSSKEYVTEVGDKLFQIPIIKNAEPSEKLKGFVMRDYEDIRRANYTGPATLNEFSSYLSMSLQLYLSGDIDFETFSKDLNTEWTKGMKTAIEAAGWSTDNNYGITMP